MLKAEMKVISPKDVREYRNPKWAALWIYRLMQNEFLLLSRGPFLAFKCDHLEFDEARNDQLAGRGILFERRSTAVALE